MVTILNEIITIIYGLLGIGVIILIHELGHFIFAKIFGVKVETFSIGFGKGLIKFKRDDTVYQIGYLPFGGYCKLAGEEPESNREPYEYEFYAKSAFKRLIIVFAGPFMNYLSGVIFFIIVLIMGVSFETYSNKILVLNELEFKNKKIISPAKQYGLKDGDEIIEIEKKPIKFYKEITREIISRGDENFVNIKVKRGNKILDLKVKPVIIPEMGLSVIGIIPYISNEIEVVVTNTPAYFKGLKPKDKIIKIDNIRTLNYKDIKLLLAERGGKVVNFTILRDGIERNFTIKLSNINGSGFLGVGFKGENKIFIDNEKSILKAIYNGWKRANGALGDVLYSLRTIIRGKVMASKAVAGPLRIIQITGEYTKKGGVSSFLTILGALSITLAFFNLLPIPAVDGSFILIFLLETIIRKKINYNVIKIVQRVGFIIIILLTVLILFLDIKNIARPDNNEILSPFQTLISNLNIIGKYKVV